ncbi:MAG: GNAT family N-acetyltransferase [Candidatus Lokiarchaeota archaeon]|nr:GNAT family N-acetyltransferase [Candidatus Lokiarchaeota archaeon]
MPDIEIIKTEDQLDEFRELYFNSLSETQELYIELLINPEEELDITSPKRYLIRNKQVDIGYCIVSNVNIILEFFLIDEYIPICEDIFKIILKKLIISKAYCKSFDHLFLKCCITYHKSIKLYGVLFRDMINRAIKLPHPDLRSRLGEIQDFSEISLFKEGVFENDGELRKYLYSKKLFVFLIHNEITGYGIFSRTIKNRPDFDIGMAVHPKFRKKGYGSYIINNIKNFCLKNNWRPTCGCIIDNIGSRRTLEKAGFISKHNLLEIHF